MIINIQGMEKNDIRRILAIAAWKCLPGWHEEVWYEDGKLIFTDDMTSTTMSMRRYFHEEGYVGKIEGSGVFSERWYCCTCDEEEHESEDHDEWCGCDGTGWRFTLKNWLEIAENGDYYDELVEKILEMMKK